MGVFGWQLVRSSSPKYLLHPPVFPRVAGELFHRFVHFFIFFSSYVIHSIVEFASQEDSQRAIRELSEQPLLGRPVFIREVCTQLSYGTRHTQWPLRTGKMNPVSARHPCLEKLAWLWLVKASLLVHLHVQH